MKILISVKNLDCPVCASKVEDAVRKIKGVENASLSFMTEKMTIEAEDNAGKEKLIKHIIKACVKTEPDCEAELIG